MQRVMVIGSPGSGKSTLARALGERTGLPVVHIDRMFYSPGWVQRPAAQTDALARAALMEERWILDGNHSKSFPARVARADLLVFLDFPSWTCVRRVLRRTREWRGRTRPDMPPDCPERIDLGFLHFVVSYGWRGRRRARKLLKATRGQLRQETLRSDAEVARFLEGFGG